MSNLWMARATSWLRLAGNLAKYYRRKSLHPPLSCLLLALHPSDELKRTMNQVALRAVESVWTTSRSCSRLLLCWSAYPFWGRTAACQGRLSQKVVVAWLCLVPYQHLLQYHSTQILHFPNSSLLLLPLILSILYHVVKVLPTKPADDCCFCYWMDFLSA